jgi:hypothetical protein
VNSRAEVTVFRFQHLAVHVHEVNDFTVVVRNDSSDLDARHRNCFGNEGAECVNPLTREG